jgi:hypothetical protein
MALMAALAGVSCPAPPAATKGEGSQALAYAKRSVEIVALGSRGDVNNLAELVDPKAEFALGRGDVLFPLDAGIAGARNMAQQLRANSYVYHGIVGLPKPFDACGPQDVDVEFLGSDPSESATVRFHYDGGILRSAIGGWGPRYSGPVQVERR